MGATHYYWDPVTDNMFMETDENGDVIATYDYEPTYHGELNSMTRDGKTYYPHYDGMGNVVAVTDENENVVEETTYTAFGEVVSKTSSITNPFGYKGALGYYTNGDTDDIYVRARTYEPSVGRWISADPLGFVDGTNWYAYCRNNPVTHQDPSGLVCDADIADWLIPDPLPNDNPKREPIGVVDASLRVFAAACGCHLGGGPHYGVDVVIDSATLSRGGWIVRPGTRGFFEALVTGTAKIEPIGLSDLCSTKIRFDRQGRAGNNIRAIVSFRCSIPCDDDVLTNLQTGGQCCTNPNAGPCFGECRDVREAVALTYVVINPLPFPPTPLLLPLQQLRVDWRIGLRNKDECCFFESCSALLQLNAWPPRGGPPVPPIQPLPPIP